MISHDVNAAVRGARRAGAERILIKDSHGNSKNLLIEDLEPGVELVSGHGSLTDGMMVGVDSSFGCAMLVGYHAMAGTLGGIMEHTITGGVHRLWGERRRNRRNGSQRRGGGNLRVPLTMVSSDAAAAPKPRL